MVYVIIIKYFGKVDLQYVSLGCNVVMSSRKYVTLEEAVDSLLGDDNVCKEQAIATVHPEQGYGYATNLDYGEDDVSHSLDTLAENVAGCVEVCGDSLEKNMLLSRPSTALAPQLKRKNINPPQMLQTGNVAQT